MVTQELVDLIAAKFQQGESGKKIRESLVAKGYEDEDISSAISFIQKQAFMELPVYKFFAEKWHHWDTKTANLSSKAIIAFFLFLGCILLVIAYFLYAITDPFGRRLIVREDDRKKAMQQFQVALSNYYAEHREFPSKLEDLVPQYMHTLLVDPRSGKTYPYVLSRDAQNYQFCVEFELQNTSCVVTENPGDKVNPDLPLMVPQQTKAATGYTIYGLVFMDTNKDGVRDNTGESGYGNASVQVIDSTGRPACETVSDQEGNFTCSLQDAGTYTVAIHVPSYFKFTHPNPQTVTFGQDVSKKSISVLLGLVGS